VAQNSPVQRPLSGDPMSQIILRNGTQELIHVAIFRKPTRHPNLGSFAWMVVSPPPAGQSVVAIPQYYEVYVNVPTTPEERTDPNSGARTPAISISDFTSRFRVQEEAGDTVSLVQAEEGLVPGELRIDNLAGVGVWTHIQQNGVDIYRPQALAPGSSFLAAQPSTPFYLAVVSGSSREGSLLSEVEISTTTIPILPGQTATVTGSVWSGYEIEVEHGDTDA
jgi:hypothetical protein